QSTIADCLLPIAYSSLPRLHWPLCSRHDPPLRVTATHQAGLAAWRRAAARSAAACELNMPKTVAPDPDIRASRHSGSAETALTTVPTTLASSLAGSNRSLRLRRSHCANSINDLKPGGTGHIGVRSSWRSRRKTLRVDSA